MIMDCTLQDLDMLKTAVETQLRLLNSYINKSQNDIVRILKYQTLLRKIEDEILKNN